MAGEQDVKPNVPATSTETKPVEQKPTETQSSTQDVKPGVSQPQSTEKGEFVPRVRLNEELEKRHQLEMELEELKGRQPAPQPAIPPQPQVNEIDRLAEEMSRNSGVDETYGTPNISLAQAKAMLQMQVRMNEVSLSGLRMRDNVAKFVKRTADAAQYADTIETELGKLPPGVRDNPANVEKMYYELIGRDVAKAKLDAYSKGRKDGMENTRIATNATVDTTGVNTDTPKPVELTELEKVTAKKLGLTEEAYLKSKQKGLEQRGRK